MFGSAGIVILVAGAAVVAFGGEKPLRVLDKNCEPVTYAPKTEKAALALIARFQKLGMKAARAIGGFDALGPAPSDRATVKFFAAAWSTQWLWLAAPGCMKKLGIDEQLLAGGVNPFGPDMDEFVSPSDVPAAVAQAAQEAVRAITVELTLRGYDTGMTLAVAEGVSFGSVMFENRYGARERRRAGRSRRRRF